jgi:hypothetical protein
MVLGLLNSIIIGGLGNISGSAADDGLQRPLAIGERLWQDLASSAGPGWTLQLMNRWFADSLLEEAGFEPSVPPLFPFVSRSIPVRVSIQRVGAHPPATWPQTRIGLWPAMFYHLSGRL